MFENMNNNGVGYNNRNQRNITTHFTAFFGEESQLLLQGWNDRLSIKIAPLKGKTPEGLKMYAKDIMDTVATAFSRDACISILEGIKDKIIPAIKDNKDVSIGIAVGANENKKVVEICVKDGLVRLIVNTNADAEGKCNDQNNFSYLFSTRSYLDDYDPVVGATNPVPVQAEFLQFVETLKEFVANTGVQVHIDKYKKSFSQNSNGGGYGRPMGGNQYQGQIEPAPTNNFSGSNLGDFLPFN